MIVRYDEAGRLVGDCAWIAGYLDRPASTVRARCRPVATDPATGHNLYDAAACEDTLAAVPQRAAHHRPTRRRPAA